MKYILRTASAAVLLASLLVAVGALAAVVVLAVTSVMVLAFRAGGWWAVWAGTVLAGMLGIVGAGLFV